MWFLSCLDTSPYGLFWKEVFLRFFHLDDWLFNFFCWNICFRFLTFLILNFITLTMREQINTDRPLHFLAYLVLIASPIKFYFFIFRDALLFLRNLCHSLPSESSFGLNWGSCNKFFLPICHYCWLLVCVKYSCRISFLNLYCLRISRQIDTSSLWFSATGAFSIISCRFNLWSSRCSYTLFWRRLRSSFILWTRSSQFLRLGFAPFFGGFNVLR